jgi:hypothetical protein
LWCLSLKKINSVGFPLVICFVLFVSFNIFGACVRASFYLLRGSSNPRICYKAFLFERVWFFAVRFHLLGTRILDFLSI